eukprot:3005663-Rhodomonas_salina.2
MDTRSLHRGCIVPGFLASPRPWSRSGQSRGCQRSHGTDGRSRCSSLRRGRSNPGSSELVVRNPCVRESYCHSLPVCPLQCGFSTRHCYAYNRNRTMLRAHFNSPNSISATDRRANLCALPRVLRITDHTHKRHARRARSWQSHKLATHSHDCAGNPSSQALWATQGEQGSTESAMASLGMAEPVTV